ncbi:MAG TPA: hypothetical protein PKI32_04210 [Opitutales bacterium]|nr:hypothetical protein [Opitutales bacterium]
MDSVFSKLQEAVVARLKRRSDLKGVPVILRKNGIAATIRESVAKFGLCVVVMPPRPKDADPTQGTPIFTQVVLTVRVVENAFRLHAGPDSMEVAEIVTRALQAWQPQTVGITAPLAIDGDDAWSLDDEPDKKGRYTIEIKFNTSATV